MSQSVDRRPLKSLMNFIKIKTTPRVPRFNRRDIVTSMDAVKEMSSTAKAEKNNFILFHDVNKGGVSSPPNN